VWHDAAVGQATAGQAALERARAGDEQAFRELTDPHRRELQVHCYRILGSLTDAEDMLQETLLAAWRGLGDLREPATLRSWLYRIATNRCLNQLRSAGRRFPAEPVPPFRPPEPRMPPRQAAALVLRDVLGFATWEVAGMLHTSPAAVKGALARARASLAHDQGGARADRARPGSAEEGELSRRFAAAYVAGDLDGVVALLTDDAWLSMPPAPHEYQGADAIGAFFRASFSWRGDRRVRLLPARANGQTAFGSYLCVDGGPVALPAGLIVLTVGRDRIRAITRFHLDFLYRRFGLPASLGPT